MLKLVSQQRRNTARPLPSQQKAVSSQKLVTYKTSQTIATTVTKDDTQQAYFQTCSRDKSGKDSCRQSSENVYQSLQETPPQIKRRMQNGGIRRVESANHMSSPRPPTQPRGFCDHLEITKHASQSIQLSSVFKQISLSRSPTASMVQKSPKFSGHQHTPTKVNKSGSYRDEIKRLG